MGEVAVGTLLALAMLLEVHAELGLVQICNLLELIRSLRKSSRRHTKIDNFHGEGLTMSICPIQVGQLMAGYSWDIVETGLALAE